jgi:hypothetical protein
MPRWCCGTSMFDMRYSTRMTRIMGGNSDLTMTIVLVGVWGAVQRRLGKGYVLTSWGQTYARCCGEFIFAFVVVPLQSSFDLVFCMISVCFYLFCHYCKHFYSQNIVKFRSLNYAHFFVSHADTADRAFADASDISKYNEVNVSPSPEKYGFEMSTWNGRTAWRSR